jgi:translation initiation factor IF-2
VIRGQALRRVDEDAGRRVPRRLGRVAGVRPAADRGDRRRPGDGDGRHRQGGPRWPRAGPVASPGRDAGQLQGAHPGADALPQHAAGPPPRAAGPVGHRPAAAGGGRPGDDRDVPRGLPQRGSVPGVPVPSGPTLAGPAGRAPAGRPRPAAAGGDGRRPGRCPTGCGPPGEAADRTGGVEGEGGGSPGRDLRAHGVAV